MVRTFYVVWYFVAGLNDADEVGTWRYTNGESLTYSNWPGGAPRSKRTVHRKNCVLVDKKRRMRNKICNTRKARLICEQDIGAKDPDRAPPKRDISSRVKSGRRNRSKSRNRQKDGRSSRNRREVFWWNFRVKFGVNQTLGKLKPDIAAKWNLFCKWYARIKYDRQILTLAWKWGLPEYYSSSWLRICTHRRSCSVNKHLISDPKFIYTLCLIYINMCLFIIYRPLFLKVLLAVVKKASLGTLIFIRWTCYVYKRLRSEQNSSVFVRAAKRK